MTLFVPGAVFNSDAQRMNTVVLLEMIGPSMNTSAVGNDRSQLYSDYSDQRAILVKENIAIIPANMSNNASTNLPGALFLSLT